MSSEGGATKHTDYLNYLMGERKEWESYLRGCALSPSGYRSDAKKEIERITREIDNQLELINSSPKPQSKSNNKEDV